MNTDDVIELQKEIEHLRKSLEQACKSYLDLWACFPRENSTSALRCWHVGHEGPYVDGRCRACHNAHILREERIEAHMRIILSLSSASVPQNSNESKP